VVKVNSETVKVDLGDGFMVEVKKSAAAGDPDVAQADAPAAMPSGAPAAGAPVVWRWVTNDAAIAASAAPAAGAPVVRRSSLAAAAPAAAPPTPAPAATAGGGDFPGLDVYKYKRYRARRGSSCSSGSASSSSSAAQPGADVKHDLETIASQASDSPTKAQKGGGGGGRKTHAATCCICKKPVYYYYKSCSSATGKKVVLCGTRSERGSACLVRHVISEYQQANE